MKSTSRQKGSFAPKNQLGPILKLLEGFNIRIARIRCNALSRALANKLMAASNPNTFLSVPLQKKRVLEIQQFLSGQVWTRSSKWTTGVSWQFSMHAEKWDETITREKGTRRFNRMNHPLRADLIFITAPNVIMNRRNEKHRNATKTPMMIIAVCTRP